MPAQRTLRADFKGLVTAPGALLRSESSFVAASNVLFDAPGLMRKRPGFSRLSNGFGASVYQVHSSPILDDNLLVHYGFGGPVTMRVGSGTGPSALVPSIDPQSVTRPINLKQRLALLGKSHYLTSDEGIRRIEAGISSVRYAGMPRGMAPDTANMDAAVYTILGVTTPTWLALNSSAAYRVTWHRLDDSGLELGGPPTGRVVIRNITGTTGGGAAARSVTLRLPVPREWGTLQTALTTSYFYRLWRSRSTTGEPDDEMYLVAEAFLTAGDITNGYAVATDLTPDSILIGNASLHTNPVDYPVGEAGLKQGQFNADDPPPLGNDVASWRECLWIADTTTRPAYTLQLRGVGGAGLVAGDTITLDGVNTMTAVAVAPGANQFTVVTGLATLALNIEATMRNIVERHNKLYATLGTSTVWAYYTSLGTQAPGYIFVEGKRATDGASPAVSRVAAFGPVPTSASVDYGQNQVLFSKAGRGDAFPVVNALQVGPAQATILRLQPYRDRLLIFTDFGIYQVTGSSWADFSVAPFDLTYRLIGRNHVATCDDRVYAWCFEGIVEIDEGGVRVISTPIEPTILSVTTTGGDALGSYGFSVAYRLKHRVLFFWSPGSAVGDKGCAEALIWDTRTRLWSQLTFGATDNTYKSCAVARYNDDRLILGWVNPGGGDGYLFQERAALSNADYQDDDATGASAPVSVLAALQFQLPDAGASLHWQATMVHLDGLEFSWRALPTSFSATFTSEWGSSSAITLTPNGRSIRFEPPTEVRRANRLLLSLQHTTAEAFGIIGVSQLVRAGSNFTMRGR